jgi:hypothetical protein
MTKSAEKYYYLTQEGVNWKLPLGSKATDVVIQNTIKAYIERNVRLEGSKLKEFLNNSDSKLEFNDLVKQIKSLNELVDSRFLIVEKTTKEKVFTNMVSYELTDN